LLLPAEFFFTTTLTCSSSNRNLFFYDNRSAIFNVFVVAYAVIANIFTITFASMFNIGTIGITITTEEGFFIYTSLTKSLSINLC
jgi:hypothetical protein